MSDYEPLPGEVYLFDIDNNCRRGPFKSEAEAREEGKRLREADILSDNAQIEVHL